MKPSALLTWLVVSAALGCDETTDPPPSSDAVVDAAPDAPVLDTSPDGTPTTTCVDLSPGSLDPTFGDGAGYVVHSFGEGATELGKRLSVLDDGRILVAFERRPASGSARFAIARFTADGMLDPSFGGDGYSELDLGLNADVPRGMVETEGRATLAGYATIEGVLQGALVRFDPSGAPDPRLGGDGSATFDLVPGEGERFNEVAFDGSGRMLVAGTVGDRAGMIAARLTVDGALDPAFAGDGFDIITGAGPTSGESVETDGNELLVAGTIGGLFGMARYDDAGAVDPTFSGDGVVDTGVTGTALQILRDLLGRYLVVGFHDEGAPRLTAARYMPTGMPDPMFAGGSHASHGLGADRSRAHGAVQDQRSKFVLVGDAVTDGVTEMVVARLLSDGTLDTSFADAGVRKIRFDGVDASLRGVAVDASGRVVASGWATIDGEIDLVLVRLCS